MFRSAQHDRERRQWIFNASTFHRLKDSEIMPDAHCAKTHVKIRKADPKQTEPCPKHVASVKTSHACVSAVTRWRFGKLVQKTPGQVPKRMTTKRITAEQNKVDCKHDRADANSKSI